MFDICRTCTNAIDPLEGPIPLNSTLQIEDDKVIVSDVLQIFVLIHITSNDCLPNVICNSCKLKATNAYSFWKMCKRSQEKLLEPLQLINVKVEPCMDEESCEFDVPEPEDKVNNITVKTLDLINDIKEEPIREQCDSDSETEQSDCLVQEDPTSKFVLRLQCGSLDKTKEEAIKTLDRHNSGESESDGESLSTELADAANKGTFNSLPEVSRKKYEETYERFMKWQETNGTNSFSKDLLLTYFGELKKSYKSSTLWSIYSMLRSTIQLKHSINIASYWQLRSFLKKASVDYIPKKSKTFSPTQIQTFLKQAADEKFLFYKVVLVIAIMGNCQRDELWKLKMDHIEDLNSALVIKIPDRKRNERRTFTVTGDFYKICKKYMSLRPPNYHENRFFLNFQKGRCTRQAVGINKIGLAPRYIATYLKLPNPELYTGHCFKRSSTKLSNDASRDLVSNHRSNVLHELVECKLDDASTKVLLNVESIFKSCYSKSR